MLAINNQKLKNNANVKHRDINLTKDNKVHWKSKKKIKMKEIKSKQIDTSHLWSGWHSSSIYFLTCVLRPITEGKANGNLLQSISFPGLP